MKSYFLGTHDNQQNLENIDQDSQSLEWILAHDSLQDLFDMHDKQSFASLGDCVQHCDCLFGVREADCCSESDCPECGGLGVTDVDCGCEMGVYVDREAFKQALKEKHLNHISKLVQTKPIENIIGLYMFSDFISRELVERLDNAMEKLIEKAEKRVDTRE